MPNNRSQGGGSGRRGRKHSTTGAPKGPRQQLPALGEVKRPVAQSRELKRLLEGLGTPEPSPLKPDEFQLEALAALEFEDVLVTAPTGSGKTWIAREEIRRLLSEGKRAWYTSPLKALTNTKFAE